MSGRVHANAWVIILVLAIGVTGGIWWADGGGKVVRASGDIAIDTVPNTASLDGKLDTVKHRDDHLVITGENLSPYYGKAQGRVIVVTLPNGEDVIAELDRDRSDSLNNKGTYVVKHANLSAGTYEIRIEEKQMADNYQREWAVIERNTVEIG